MKKYNQLGSQEMLALGLLVTNTMLFFDPPRYVFIMAGNAAWLATLISGATAVSFYLLIGLALEKYPGKGLLQLSTFCFGNFVGKLCNLTLMLFFTLLTSAGLRQLGEAVVMTTIPQVPISVIIIGALSFCIYTAFRGINALAKSCYVALPFLGAGVVLLLLLTSSYWRITEIFPILGLGPKQTLLGGLKGAASFGDLIAVTILAGTVQIGASRLKPLLQAAALSALMYLLVVLTIGMVFPYPVAAELTLPYYSVSRAISLGFFLQRLEALFLVSWVVAILLKLAITFNVALFIYKETFAIPDSSPLVVPYAGLVFAISLIPASFMEASTLTVRWVKMYLGVITLVIPALIALISLWKARAAKGKPKEEAA